MSRLDALAEEYCRANKAMWEAGDALIEANSTNDTGLIQSARTGYSDAKDSAMDAYNAFMKESGAMEWDNRKIP